MHELSLMNDLMHKIESVAREHGGKVIGVRVRLGALSHLSPDHLRDHFNVAASGTVADGAELEIETLTDTHNPHAQEVWLDSVTFEE